MAARVHRLSNVLVLVIAVALVAAAVAIPLLTGWDVHARNDGHVELAPWHGWWEPHVGPGTLPSVLLAGLALWGALRAATALSWRRLLVVAYLASLAWLLSLALVDGASGLSRVLGNPHEYLGTARTVSAGGTDAIGPLLASWVDRIPIHAEQNWTTHVAGHPPGMLLFFIALVWMGLGGDLAAGIVVTAIAASIAPAVLITLRRLGTESVARRAAPFLVFTPSAVFLAVSADAVMAAVAAWAMSLLALAASPTFRRSIVWAALAGVSFGILVLMSYGLVLFAIIAIGLLYGTKAYRVFLPCAVGAFVVVLLPAAAGFWWPEALIVLRERYWDGVAARRPGAYWTWANLALLVATAGPVVATGLTRIRALPRPVIAVVIATVAAVALADLSQMSRAEVERIWLPFIPWLTVAVAALPERWMRGALASQLVVALALQHLLYTSW